MKCLIGVESVGELAENLKLIKRLSPSPLELRLFHAIDSGRAVPGYGLYPMAEMSASIVEALQDGGERLLCDAKELACELGVPVSTRLQWGPVSSTLLEEAEASKANLIALHRRDLSGLERLFLGSVTRAAVIGSKSSVLITKGTVKEDGPVSAVLAVDHSDYCDRCVDLLVYMGFRGLKNLTIVSAYADVRSLELPNTITDGFRTELERKTEAIAARFKALGVTCTPIVAEGPVTRILRDAMISSKADLMIVGAQGHGFLDRVLIGSVSLHEVAAEPYSVMVLRA